MTLDELINEPRWPNDDPEWPQCLNRGLGLLEMCYSIFPKSTDAVPWKHPRICDVGVAKGISTQIFSFFGEVDGVDISLWDEAKHLNGHRGIRLIEMDSLSRAKLVSEAKAPRYDLVYLDDIHEEEWLLKEIPAWLPCVKKGGWIGGHDACPAFPGVMRAVAKTLGGWDHIFRDGSWIRRVF